MYRAVIDSSTGTSYVSAKLIHHLKVQPIEVETKQINMLMTKKQTCLKTYQLKIESLDHHHKMEVALMKVDKAKPSY